jgi:hypothetical protein
VLLKIASSASSGLPIENNFDPEFLFSSSTKRGKNRAVFAQRSSFRIGADWHCPGGIAEREFIDQNCSPPDD